MGIQDLIFLGTGTSGMVPSIHCLTDPEPSCKVCLSSLAPAPPGPPGSDPPRRILQWSRNRRRNTSAVVRYAHSDGSFKTILIDVGKTFYEASLQWFTYYGLRKIDAVLLTHGHSDAFLGMDDLRQWTMGKIQPHVPVFCTRETMGDVERAFPYCIDAAKATGGGDVPNLQFTIIDADKPFTLFDELSVTPLPVHHGSYSSGAPFINLGFRLGPLSYVADVSAIPDGCWALMAGSACVVLDGLKADPHASHFSVPQALAALARLRPRLGLLTGFAHTVDHATLAAELAADPALRASGVVVRPAYDGLLVRLDALVADSPTDDALLRADVWEVPPDGYV